jgi:hypothetical protein
MPEYVGTSLARGTGKSQQIAAPIDPVGKPVSIVRFFLYRWVWSVSVQRSTKF